MASIAELLTGIGSVVTQFLSWLGQMLTFVWQQPLLLIFVILVVLAIALRYLRKWLPGL